MGHRHVRNESEYKDNCFYNLFSVMDYSFLLWIRAQTYI